MAHKSVGDHLFISYASEDWVFAEWLALRLTSEGYKVWCDRFELLGGESYPKDIDKAIKEKTFRVLALMSKNSVIKDNPIKERTMALNLGKRRGVNFLIPLNIDGLSPTDLDWMTGDITYVPFHNSWAEGLTQLLKKLESIETPRTVENGREIATGLYLHHTTISDNTESLFSNCLRVSRIPTSLLEIRFKDPISPNERDILTSKWAFFSKDSITVFSFNPPPDSDIFPFTIHNVHDWEQKDNILGISTENIIKNLLKRSLVVKCMEKGLHRTDTGQIYFPFGLFEEDKWRFKGFKGKRTWILIAGERSFPKNFKYHISPSFKIRKDDKSYITQLFIHLHLTDEFGSPLASRSATARHKTIRKSWWNNHFLNRSLAVVEFLSDGQSKITIGEGNTRVDFSSDFIRFDSPVQVVEDDSENLPENETEEEFELIIEEEED